MSGAGVWGGTGGGKARGRIGWYKLGVGDEWELGWGWAVEIERGWGCRGTA